MAKISGCDERGLDACFEKIGEAAKELTDVVEVTQAQEQGLSVVNILLATYRTMHVLLEEVTAIKAQLGRLKPSFTKREVLESGDEDSDAPQVQEEESGEQGVE
jgi:hypothetical protein